MVRRFALCGELAQALGRETAHLALGADGVAGNRNVGEIRSPQSPYDLHPPGVLYGRHAAGTG